MFRKKGGFTLATLIIIFVLVLFLTAIFTGGYTKDFRERVKKTKVWDWLTTVDHKKIGILYFMAGFFFFLLAGLEAFLMRLQLVLPGNDFIIGDPYNQLLTMHGTTMMFLAAPPIPLQIGARDVAFPFLNALGFWLFLFGGILLNLGWIFGGAPDAGWTSYPSLALNP